MGLAACLIFIVTLVLVIWQPRNLNVGWSASAGAVLSLLFGVVSWSDVLAVIDIVWNATFALIALIIISLVLDEIGFFEWAALHMARLSRGNARHLFVWIILLGAVMSALFANDGAILIITPIVLSMMRQINVTGRWILPFVMASGFIADTASLPFVISNLVNILSADFFAVGFVEYASRMLVPTMVSVAASLAVLFLVYRWALPESYELDRLQSPQEAIRDPRIFRMSWIVLGGLLAAYFVSEPLGIPISFLAGAAALLLLLMARRSPAVDVPGLLRSAPWNVVVFSAGMYIVVYGLHNAGYTDLLASLVQKLAESGLFAAAIGMGFIAGILSSVMNNLPTVVFDALAIQSTETEGLLREALIYANVIGSDLGPKMTPIGSLATLLWLHVLSRRRVKISWGYYFRIGVLLTVPTLFATLAGLWLWLSVIDAFEWTVWQAAAVSLLLYAVIGLAAVFMVLWTRRRITKASEQMDLGQHSSA